MTTTTFELLRDAGPGTWRTFFEHWGSNPEPHATAPPAVPVPAQLREFHAVATPMLVNRFVGLPALAVEDERVVVYVEEQGVYSWALRMTDLDQQDPPVEGSYGEGTWTVQAPRLSVFLCQVLVLDAALGDVSIASADALTAAEAAPVLELLEPLPWPAWEWPPRRTTFHAGDGLVAVVTEDDDLRWVWVGARSPEALAAVQRRATSDRWDLHDDARR